MSYKPFITTDDIGILQMYQNKSMSVKDIALLFKLSISTVRRRLIQHIKMRTGLETRRLRGDDIGSHLRGKSRILSQTHKNAMKKGAISRWDRDAVGHTLKKSSGYLVVTRGINKSRQYHQVVYEGYYNIKISPDQVVHHINGNKLDNRIENLQLLTKEEHSSLHAKINYQKRIKNEKGQFV